MKFIIAVFESKFPRDVHNNASSISLISFAFVIGPYIIFTLTVRVSFRLSDLEMRFAPREPEKTNQYLTIFLSYFSLGTRA